MKKLTKEEIQWMKENMNEVVSELRFKSELVKNFCTNPLLLGHIRRNSCVIIGCFWV